VLKDAGGTRYMRLADEGLFLWQLMDGSRTIRDLCQAYVARCQRPLDDVMPAIACLLDKGFIEIEGLPGRPCCSRPRPQGPARILALCTCYWWLPGMDPVVTALHARFCLLFAPAAQLALFLCAAAGLLVFAGHLAQFGTGASGGASALPVWIAGLALHVLVHEAAHAATAKHFGRAVHRVGIGWYYFAPVAFVDTSDCWAAARLQRILVSAAGPYSNLVLGGLAALLAFLVQAGPFANALWGFCSIGCALALLNLNPLLELDGYYMAMDAFELPNLRSRALGAIGAVLHGRGREPALAAFGAASLAYGAMVIAAILTAGRAHIESLAATSLPAGGAHALGFAGAGLMGTLLLYRLLGELLKGWHEARSQA
jgi:putative peptide zinc metalloprotease protein